MYEESGAFEGAALGKLPKTVECNLSRQRAGNLAGRRTPNTIGDHEDCGNGFDAENSSVVLAGFLADGQVAKKKRILVMLPDQPDITASGDLYRTFRECGEFCGERF